MTNKTLGREGLPRRRVARAGARKEREAGPTPHQQDFGAYTVGEFRACEKNDSTPTLSALQHS
jgi:hypothetical protein